MKDKKIKRIVELFESEDALKVVHAPNVDRTSSVIGDVFRVKDAFKMLMDSRGDALKKAPGKGHRKFKKSSTRKETASSKKNSK